MVDSYTKYDYLFRHLLPNTVGSVAILSREDNYLIKQDYKAVTFSPIWESSVLRFWWMNAVSASSQANECRGVPSG